MGLGHYLFSFRGRINRARQWALLLVTLAHAIIIWTLFSFTIGFDTLFALVQGHTTAAAIIGSPQARMFGVIFCVLYVIVLYIAFAVTTKRLHDRNKSAWWLAIFFLLPLVLQLPALAHMPAMFAQLGAAMRAARDHLPPPPPLVEPASVVLTRLAATLISLWAFVELYCLRGTVGENRFGPDPLG